MSERRSLVEAVQPTEIDPDLAKQFIKHGTIKPSPAAAPEAPPETPARAKRPPADDPRASLGEDRRRVQLTTRLRHDLAEALRRAALQRELEGLVPYLQQEIIEQALEPWLKQNGYLA